jgi:hypothetical protein
MICSSVNRVVFISAILQNLRTNCHYFGTAGREQVRSTCSHEFERQRQNSLRDVSTNLGECQRKGLRGKREPKKDFPKAGDDSRADALS